MIIFSCSVIRGYDAEDQIDYLTFIAEEDGVTISFRWNTGSDVKYRKDNGQWNAYVAGTDIYLNKDNVVNFKGNKVGTNSSQHFTIKGGKVNALGCVDSLRLDDEGKFQELTNSCYSYMFFGCENLITAPSLSAKNLAVNCYKSMFSGCTNLTTAPELPATSLADYCYQNMFYNCKMLDKAPALPAKVLADHCYSNMFWNCSNLNNPPDLSAINSLANYCYDNMFYGCKNLKLSKIKSANYQYEWKFKVADLLLPIDARYSNIFGESTIKDLIPDDNGYVTLYSAYPVNEPYFVNNSLELTETESKDSSLNLELFEDNSSESESYNNSSDLNKTESKPLYSADSLANDEDLTYSQDSLGSSGSNNNSLNSGDSSSISESSSSGRSGSSASIKTGSESLLMLLSYIGLFSGTLLSLRKRKDD